MAIFKIRLLSIIGFKPRINKCVNCNSQDIHYFSLKDNGFKCEACARQDKSSIELSDTTVKAIRYIILSEPKKIYSFELADENKLQLKLLAKLYLNECLEKEYE